MELAIRTIGQPSRGREIGGAIVLLGGAVALAGLATVDTPFYRNLLVLGSVAVVAWLVDGTSRRYMGPGLMALAAGLGITIGVDGGVTPFEHTLVYAGFGVALLVISYFNLQTVRAAGAFLLYTGITVAASAWVASVPIGWELAAIVAVWGVFELIRIQRSTPADEEPAAPSRDQPEMAGRR